MGWLFHKYRKWKTYSINETFLNLEGIRDIQSFRTDIINKVIRGTGIPVSSGSLRLKHLQRSPINLQRNILPTIAYVSLAQKKSASRPYSLLKLVIYGGSVAGKLPGLEKQGVKTAYDSTKLPGSWMRKNMTVVGERTWKELLGISCIDIET